MTKAEGWPQPLPGRQMTRHSRIIIEGEPPGCFPPALRFELDADGGPTDVEA